MLLTELKYQLFKNKPRSVLLVCLSLLICTVMFLYLGSVQKTEAALKTLKETSPVAVKIVSRNGEHTGGLAIKERYYDLLAQGDLRELNATVSGAAVFDPEKQALAAERRSAADCDMRVVGINRMEASPLRNVTYTYGPDETEAVLEGTEAKCLLDAIFAEKRNIHIGDTITVPVYLYIPQNDYDYWVIHRQIYSGPITVAGTYADASGEETMVTVLLPTAWMRKEANDRSQEFFYDSCSGLLKEPGKLNEFKERMAWSGFFEAVSDSGRNAYIGDALSIEDSVYLKTAAELEETLSAYRAFLAPFFGLVIVLITLVIFLTLRSARKDMAISISLGRSRRLVAAAHFYSVLLAALVGCVVAVPIMLLAAGLTVSIVFLICGLFLLCIAVGAALALALLLHFDAMALLTKID